jgi:hypothetical protein
MPRHFPVSHLLALGAAVSATLLVCGVGRCLSPPASTDEELARHPIIVVGRWNGARLRPHERLEPSPTVGQHVTASETHTELIVERVIKGDIQPGTYRILLPFGIGWLRPDGGRVMAYWSSEKSGDVEEVTEPNLWFLLPARSWDESDRESYLGLATYRGVQPLSKEDYFRELAERCAEPKEEHTSATWLWLAGAGAVIVLGGLVAWRLGRTGRRTRRRPQYGYSGRYV